MDRKLTGTQYILLALIPYTKPNLQFSFARKSFFREVAIRDKIHEKAARSGFYRAIKQGLLEQDDYGNFRLTNKGRRRIAPYTARYLANSSLMVIFDIPEAERTKRSHVRSLLRELSFEQVQKSVWISEYDHRSLIKMEIDHLNLQNYVQVFECYKLS